MTGQATSKTFTETREIKLAHSPDSDDAFMFYALARTSSTPWLQIYARAQRYSDVERSRAYRNVRRNRAEFRRVSGLRDKYVLLDCGASFGENYGPIVVAHNSMKATELAGKRVAVPGLKTTAYLTLKLFEPNFEAVVTRSTKS